MQQKQGHLTVGDFMTQASDLFVANIDTTVDEGVYCGLLPLCSFVDAFATYEGHIV